MNEFSKIYSFSQIQDKDLKQMETPIKLNKLFTSLIITDPSEALAPTLSPLAFQQTSNIPPVPLYE